MKKYYLEDLLKVRKFREEIAGNEALVKKTKLEEAVALVKKKKKELVEYRKWRIETEQKLFDDIKGKLINLKELDDIKIKIGLMREKEALLEQEIMEARKKRNSAQKKLEEAQEAYRTAIRETEKIEEHKKMWLEELTKEEEELQDKELEDFHTRKPDFDLEAEGEEAF